MAVLAAWCALAVCVAGVAGWNGDPEPSVGLLRGAVVVVLLAMPVGAGLLVAQVRLVRQTDTLHGRAAQPGPRVRLDVVLDHRSSRARRAASLALAVYLVVLAGVALLPLPGAPSPGTLGVVPIDLSLERPDLLGGWEAQRNVLMTVPLGVLLPLVVRWRYEWVLLACVATTLAIETSQLLGSLAVGWSWRAFDVDDLFNNTVGALLGVGLTGAALAWQHRTRADEDQAQGAGRRSRAGVGALPARRAVAGGLAGALVAVAVVSTITARGQTPAVDACAQPAAGAATELPEGLSAFAGADGSLCVLGPDGSTSSAAADAPSGVISELQREDGSGWQVGVTAPGGGPQAPESGAPGASWPVEGSELQVWWRPLP
ncbi:MAG: VanZ family protein [Quadrisphaera sp.]